MTPATVLAVQLEGRDVWIIVANLLLLAVLTFLAVGETAVNRISRVKAQALVDGGARPRASRALLDLVAKPEEFLNPVLLTVNVCQVAQAFLTTILVDRLFGALGLVIGFFLNVVLLFAITEAVPKTWAVQHSERAALLAARPIRALVRLWPLRLLSRALIGLANVIVPGKGLKQGPFVSEQELLGIVGAAAEDEVIEAEERELIESIISFGDTVAREIMVPRPDMVTVDGEATVSAALDVAIAEGYSRMPVVGETSDDVLGVAHTKDLIRAEREGRGADPVARWSRPAHFVPETKPVAHLMREMQAEKYHLAMLIDEYGGTAGLVTLEDCIEELVGDIVDEHDVEDREVERLDGGELLVDGGMSVDDLSDLLPIQLPEGDWDTVGGFLLSELGRLPVEGETVTYDGYVFTARRLDGRRISLVHVSRLPEADAEAVPSGAG
jgi:putative hemolysin